MIANGQINFAPLVLIQSLWSTMSRQVSEHVLSPTLNMLAAFNLLRFFCTEVGTSASSHVHWLSNPLHSGVRNTASHRKDWCHGSRHPLYTTWLVWSTVAGTQRATASKYATALLLPNILSTAFTTGWGGRYGGSRGNKKNKSLVLRQVFVCSDSLKCVVEGKDDKVAWRRKIFHFSIPFNQIKS